MFWDFLKNFLKSFSIFNKERIFQQKENKLRNILRRYRKILNKVLLGFQTYALF